MKRSTTLYDTWAEAHVALVEKAEKNVRGYEERLADALVRLGKVRAMSETDK